MKIKSLKDIPQLQDVKVLLRVDFNVPINENQITDDTRIYESLPTINHLTENGAKVIIVTHLGRPKGQVVEKLRLNLVAKKLEELLERQVTKLDQSIGDEVEKAVDQMQKGEIILLENIRFEAGEEKNDPKFAKKLADLADIYVNDAFGTAHRAHASTAGVAKFLSAYAGKLMTKEIAALSPLVEGEMIKPVTMILGGAKIDTKIGLIKHFINKVDYFLLGGGLANTFLYAAGYEIGESLSEKDKKEIAQEIMLECEKNHEKFILPHDVVAASKISNDADTADVPVEDIIGDMKILDIGKWTAEKYCDIITKSGTVIWNGPLGVAEYKPFQYGTKTIAECIAKHKCDSIIGGGDTSDAISKVNIPAEKFTHISTGGGACIEFLEGKELPGIKPLIKN